MKTEPEDKGLLMQYFTLAWQLLAGLGLAVYIGLQADKWLNIHTPLLVWLLPLLVIIAMIVKAIKDTTKKKDDKS